MRVCDFVHGVSNQCAEIIMRAIDRSTHPPESILLAHLSQEYNTNALAVGAAVKAVSDPGSHNIRLYETNPSMSGKEVVS